MNAVIKPWLVAGLVVALAGIRRVAERMTF
jgi:hypothetical protein